ncbi:MAG TPA: hypothetical protein VMA09_00995 [Candidatus Binataceae bacterium]|nr:hypothetical protein [Candidatus Binataceae bacterium]
MNRLVRNVSIFVLVAGLLPIGSWAQDTGPAAQAKAEMQNDALSGLGREEFENRRQEIVVDNMKFSNDEQKTKFLAIYVPYQEKLMNNLKQRKKLLDQYQNEQQNGVISDAEATKILNANLTLDRNRVIAESTYLHSLKSVMPMEQALRAYEIDERLNAFYLNDILGTIHLVK